MNYEPLDTLPTPVLVIALPGAKILHLNPTALREWGYANIASEGLDFAGLIVPTDEANAAALARFLAGHDPAERGVCPEASRLPPGRRDPRACLGRGLARSSRPAWAVAAGGRGSRSRRHGHGSGGYQRWWTSGLTRSS